MDKAKILVVDDEVALVDLIREWLEWGGYEAVCATDGMKGLREFFTHHPDLAILDVAMPGLNGFELCQRIREVSQIPVAMLTAKSTELDKVRGLNLGADEYLVKPLGRQELLARVSAMLRRAHMAPDSSSNVYSDAALTMDFARHETFVRGERVVLTATEYRLLAYLVQHPDQVLTQQQLWDRIWGWGEGSLESVKWHVACLRKKIEAQPDKPRFIITVRGAGYRYERQKP